MLTLKRMKRIILNVVLMVSLTACEIIVVESDYDYRSTIHGHYRLEEFSQTYNQYYRYEVEISQSSWGSSTIVINNFYNEGLSVRAEVHGNQIYIPAQTVRGYRIEGSGNIYSNEIELTYRAWDTYSTNRTDFCEATLWKSW